jgi:aprataxin
MLRADFSGANFVVEKCPDVLSPGIYEFGRSLLKFEDMRVSRSQVQLNIWPDRASITRKGKNLTCIKRGSEVIKLEIDRPEELKIDDIVYLLVSLYPIRLLQDTSGKRASSSLTGLVPISEATAPIPPAGNPKKRLRVETPNLNAVKELDQLQLLDTMESSDDEGIVLLSKKPKTVENISSAPHTQARTGHWSTSLLSYLKNPENHPDAVIIHTDELVVIKDKFPKAQLHLLVLPRQSIQNPSHLQKQHLSLVKNMEQMALNLASQWMAKGTSINFGSVPGLNSTQVLIGFHAIPSMTQLHLHVISNDFNSVALKTKKHWNSFTTPFFIPTSQIIEKLTSGDSISFEKSVYEAYIDGPMKCHRCGALQSNMPNLKSHIALCGIK